MIISVEELRKCVDTDKTDFELEAMLEALETSVRKYTNNNFQNIRKRFVSEIVNGGFTEISPYIKTGDTVQISESKYNDGLYIYADDMDLTDEPHCLVTKVEYPADIKMGVVNILKWQLRNDAANSGDVSKKDIQSETISRHSVTYAVDSTEADIDAEFGVPKKHMAFLRHYKKARF